MGMNSAVNAMGSNISPGTNLTSAVSVDRLNGIMDAIRALASADAVVGGNGIYASTHNGKTTLSSRPYKGGGVASVVQRPFDVYSINPNGDNPACLIRPGTLNGMLPTNWSESVAFTPNVVNYLYADCLAGQNIVTSCSLTTSTTPVPPIGGSFGYAPTQFKVLIGVIAANAWNRVLGAGSIVASAVEAGRFLKESPAPGEFPFHIMYTWTVTS